MNSAAQPLIALTLGDPATNGSIAIIIGVATPATHIFFLVIVFSFQSDVLA